MVVRGYIELSANLSTLTPAEIRRMRDEAASSLMRGIRRHEASEGIHLRTMDVEGNKISVIIESGARVRASDAMLRLKNLIAKNLMERRIGIRRVYANSLEVHASKDTVDLSEARQVLEGVATIVETGNQVLIEFRDLTESDLRSRMVDRAIRLVKVSEPVEKDTAVPFGTVLRRGETKPILFDQEVAMTAEKLGWIKKFPGKGQWIFGPPMTSLLRAIKEIVEDSICRPLGFKEWMFPRLMHIDVFRKLSTYVEHLPEGLFYVCPPPRNPDLFNNFKREYALKRELRTDLLKDILEEPEYVLDAVQCPPFYQYFSGEAVKMEQLPIKAYDVMGGWTWRNEAGGIEGIVRTNEFWRMEMVFLASPPDAISIRDSVIELAVQLASVDFDLEWRVVAGAPFYLSPQEAKKQMIDISSTSTIPTLDLECYVPYRGSREQADWLEVTAGTVHRSFYVDAFKIREAKRREVWTGCVGHGLTRWAAAILAQHGFEFDDWPKLLRAKVGHSQAGTSLPPPKAQ